MRVIEKGKKTFLLRTLAALVILALCAVPMLASSPAYADKGSSAGSKDSSGGKGSAGDVTVELNTGGDYTGSADCFSAKITPTTVMAGAQDVAFTLTYVNCGTNYYSPRLGKFETTVPTVFSDIQLGVTTAVSYNGSSADWTSWLSGSKIVSQADSWNDDAIYGGNLSQRGWVQVPFTADVAAYVGSLDLVDWGGTVTAGEAFDIGVAAPWNNYTGTVHFSSSDGAPWPASLPGNYHFTTGWWQDNGWHYFHNGATLYTAGLQTITVSDPATYNVDYQFTARAWKQDWHSGGGGHWDTTIQEDTNQVCDEPMVTVSGKLKSDTETFMVEPGCATRLDLTPDGGNTADPGVPFDVMVTLYDAWDNVATGYLGTVHFSSSDLLAGLPLDYTFLVSDGGIHAFISGVTLYTAGLQTVTATGTGYCPQGHPHDADGPLLECPSCEPGPGPGPGPGPNPPTPDTETWTVSAPTPTPTPTPPEEAVEEEEPAPIEGAIVLHPVLVVDMQGTVARYPVTADGRLLVDALTTSPDGLVKLLMLAGTRVLNPNGTPAYLNKDPDVFSITAATPAAPAGYTMVAAYEFLPSGITFTPDATVIIEYDAAKVPAGGAPVVAYYDEAAGQWTNLETAGYVAGGVEIPNTLQAHTAHLTYFAVLAK